MRHVARLTVSVLSTVAVLLFATSAHASTVFTLTFSGTPISSGAYAGDSVSGTLDVVASPDGFDGGYLATSITAGSLIFTGGATATDTVTGLVPLTSGTLLSGHIYEYSICNTPGCFHYWGYDNLLYPGTPDLSDGLLFAVTGLYDSAPVELFCSNAGTCDLGVYLLGQNNGNDPFDGGFEYYPVTLQQSAVPEPSTLLLLGFGFGSLILILVGFDRRQPQGERRNVLP